jgi:hypothetical protein
VPTGKPVNRPNQDEDDSDFEARSRDTALTREPGGVTRGIADMDKRVRTGSAKEGVRNTPPAGAWNETSAD